MKKGKREKKKLFMQISCGLLAFVMLGGTAFYAIYYLFVV